MTSLNTRSRFRSKFLKFMRRSNIINVNIVHHNNKFAKYKDKP